MTYYIVFRELKISNSNYFLKTIEGKFTEKSSHSLKDIKYSDEGIFCHNSPIIFRFSSEDELEPKILNLKL